MISSQHRMDILWLWSFGKLIHNTDMHLGNLSLRIDGSVFRVLPVYDMCPMGFAPKAGEVLPYGFTPSPLEDSALDEDSRAHVTQVARDFWERLASDSRISVELRDFLARGNPVDRIQKNPR
jgi:hypothetical protein